MVGSLGLQHGESVLPEEERLLVAAPAEQKDREMGLGLSNHIMITSSESLFINCKCFAESVFTLIETPQIPQADSEVDVVSGDVVMLLGAEDHLIDEERALEE